MKPQTIFFTKPGSGLFRVVLSITLALWTVSAAALTLLLRILESMGAPGGAALGLAVIAVALFAYTTLGGALGLVVISSIRRYGRGLPKNYVSGREALRRSQCRECSIDSQVGHGAGHHCGRPACYVITASSSVGCVLYHVA